MRALQRLFSQCEDIPGVDCNFPLHDPNVQVGSSYCQRFILGDEIIGRAPNNVIVEAVRAKAEAISGQPVALKGLLKRAKLYRLAKALEAAGQNP